MLEQPGEDALPLSSSSTLSSDNTHISTESTSNDIESQMTSFSVSTAVLETTILSTETSPTTSVSLHEDINSEMNTTNIINNFFPGRRQNF